ncbi:MAG: hypothetical protein JKY33_09435 [Bacteroidia bacterium]|nr:hypothetical protein [Bacteroidia bacterium]
MPRYNLAYLKKIESLFKEAGYKIRYEKGNFRSGYCILEDKKVVVVNKFVSVEVKISFFQNIITEIKFDEEVLEPESKEFYNSLLETEKK